MDKDGGIINGEMVSQCKGQIMLGYFDNWTRSVKVYMYLDVRILKIG